MFSIEQKYAQKDQKFIRFVNAQKKNWQLSIVKRMCQGLKGKTCSIYSIFYSVPFGSFGKRIFNLCKSKKKKKLDQKEIYQDVHNICLQIMRLQVTFSSFYFKKFPNYSKFSQLVYKKDSYLGDGSTNKPLVSFKKIPLKIPLAF